MIEKTVAGIAMAINQQLKQSSKYQVDRSTIGIVQQHAPPARHRSSVGNLAMVVTWIAMETALAANDQLR